jgi:hypothetical protein
VSDFDSRLLPDNHLADVRNQRLIDRYPVYLADRSVCIRALSWVTEKLGI